MIKSQQSSLRHLIRTFPREIGFPERKLVHTEQEFYEIVNARNKTTNIYFSIYKRYGDIDIDKIYFDFDCDSEDELWKVLEQVKKLHKYCNEKGYYHMMFFSGRKGFHFYIFTKNGKRLMYPKDALTRAHKRFMDNLKITPDFHCIGDIARISRVPNTMHMESKLYCIPLKREDLYKSIQYIKHIAKKQQHEYVVYGKRFFDLEKYDEILDYKKNAAKSSFDIEIKTDDKIIKSFYPCMQSIFLNLKHPTGGHDMGNYMGRFFATVYMRDLGFTQQAADKLANKHFSKVVNRGTLKGRGSNYDHFKQFKVLEYAYKRGDFVPNCPRMWDLGLCPGRCKDFRLRNFPLYK